MGYCLSKLIVNALHPPATNMTTPILCNNLMIEILSWLPVKSLMRFNCVSKSFQSLIYDPSLAKVHLQRSPKDVDFLACCVDETLTGHCVLPCSLHSPFVNDRSAGFDLQYRTVCGSCNGLVCMVSYNSIMFKKDDPCIFHFWNPATRKSFENMQCTLVHHLCHSCSLFGFGYDNLSDTYKVVVIFVTLGSRDNLFKSCDVKVCSIGDHNCWRKIQSFPADPSKFRDDGVYINSTLNWMALALPHNHIDRCNVSNITFDELVIVSLDLGNEKYSQFSLPRPLDGVHIHDFYSGGINSGLGLRALKDCLNLFLHNYRTSHFSIWQMKEIGDQKSWTPLLNIDIMKFQIDSIRFGKFLKLIMFENSVVVITDLAYWRIQVILHGGRDNILKHSINDITSLNIPWVYPVSYVQSLVSLTRY